MSFGAASSHQSKTARTEAPRTGLGAVLRTYIISRNGTGSSYSHPVRGLRVRHAVRNHCEHVSRLRVKSCVGVMQSQEVEILARVGAESGQSRARPENRACPVWRRLGWNGDMWHSVVRSCISTVWMWQLTLIRLRKAQIRHAMGRGGCVHVTISGERLSWPQRSHRLSFLFGRFYVRDPTWKLL